MNKYLFLLISVVIVLSLIFSLWIEKKDLSTLTNNKLFIAIHELSYWGMINKFRSINYSYSISTYTFQAVTIGIIGTVCVYGTIGNAYYTIIILLILIFFLPYLNFLNCKRIYNEKLEKQIFDFSSAAINYLKEGRAVTTILKDCQKIIDNPLTGKITLMNNRICKTGDLQLAIEEFEKEYPYEEILKLNTLFISKAVDGISSLTQYAILYDHIVQTEKIMNNFRIEKESKRRGFYMIVGFSLFSAFLIKNLFTTDSGMNIELMNFYYFLFYLYHIVLVILYERKHASTGKIKEKIIKSNKN